MEEASVFSHCSSLGNPWPKPTGELEHCRKVEFNCWFYIFQESFPSDRNPKGTKDVNVQLFINSSNSCKSNNEFLEIFEAAYY